MFCNAGERLNDNEVEMILKYTGTEEDLDGNIKYEGKWHLMAIVGVDTSSLKANSRPESVGLVNEPAVANVMK